MDKLLVFIKGANDSYANLSSNILGMYSNASGKIVVKFKSQDGGELVDAITLAVASGKENEMVEKISANVASARAGKIVIADSIGQTGLEPAIIKSVELITIGKPLIDSVETLVANKDLESSDSGKTFLLSDAGGFVIKLPNSNTITAGWKCKFITAIAVTGSPYRFGLVSGESATILAHSTERSISTSGSSHTSFYAGAATTLDFRNGSNAIGDAAELIFDGTQFIFAANIKTSGGLVGS
jgi:hypothetical protein